MGALRINLDKMTQFLIPIIFIAVTVVLARYCETKKAPGIRKNVEKLYLNGNFSIGTNLHVCHGSSTYIGSYFDGYSYDFVTSTGSEIKSRYLIASDAKQISKGSFSVYQRLHSDVNKEDKFFVLYDESNPKNAILLLDHPIKSDADFERYKAEIEKLRKDPNWQGYE
jgi:hypothetical protein